MVELDGERIGGIKCDVLLDQLFQPVRRSDTRPKRELGDGKRPGGATNLVAGLILPGIGGVFAGCQFPTPWRGDGIGRIKRRKNTALEPDQDDSGILDSQLSRGIRLHRMDAVDPPKK